VTAADPDHDVYHLPGSVDIWLEVVEVDPAFQVVIFGAPPRFLKWPGDSVRLGGSSLHSHLPWHINIDDPAYDPAQCVWHATFILRDAGASGLQPTAPFTFNFTNVALLALEGDFDDDGDRDLDDVAALAACLDGPGRIPQPNDPAITTCEVECMNAFDFDDDWDVDLADFAAFQQVYVE
jgi:hypothetical protein